MFRNCTGPNIVVDLLRGSSSDSDLLDAGFAVVAAAATGNEVVKQLFMELKIDEFILQVLNRESKTTIRALYDAICALLTPDDYRVVASQVSRITFGWYMPLLDCVNEIKGKWYLSSYIALSIHL